LVRLIPGLPYRASGVWLKLESGNPTPCPSPAGFEDLGVAGGEGDLGAVVVAFGGRTGHNHAHMA